MPSRRRILCGFPHLTAPSAVHLTVRFLPAFQRRGSLEGRGRLYLRFNGLECMNLQSLYCTQSCLSTSLNRLSCLKEMDAAISKTLLPAEGDRFSSNWRYAIIWIIIFVKEVAISHDQTSSHSAHGRRHCCARCCRQWPWPTRAACMCRPAMVEACICARIPSLRRIMC